MPSAWSQFVSGEYLPWLLVILVVLGLYILLKAYRWRHTPDPSQPGQRPRGEMPGDGRRRPEPETDPSVSVEYRGGTWTVRDDGQVVPVDEDDDDGSDDSEQEEDEEEMDDDERMAKQVEAAFKMISADDNMDDPEEFILGDLGDFDDGQIAVTFSTSDDSDDDATFIVDLEKLHKLVMAEPRPDWKAVLKQLAAWELERVIGIHEEYLGGL